MIRPGTKQSTLTIDSLVQDLGLSLACGAEAADAAVRWIHITELPDPTPWLSGGELLLTTGIQLDSAKTQRAFVKRLARHDATGLGFGTGFDHERLPDPLVAEAEKLGFPVFEVPYRMPFIAITEKAFTRLVNEGYEVLRRGAEIHRELERLVLEERGLDAVVESLATAVGGSAIVFDGRGRRMASSGPSPGLSEAAVDSIRAELLERRTPAAPEPRDASAFAPGYPDLAGRALALPVATRGVGAPQAWLVATCQAGPPGDFERLILQQGVTVVALELMRRRVVRDTERRLAGDVLAEALTGGLEPAEVESRLRPFGVGGRAAVIVFALEDPGAAEATLDRIASDAGVGALVATRDRLLCAVVDATDADPLELAARARAELAAGHGEVRAAASRPAPVAALRRSFHEARCALEASAMADGSPPQVASYRDLGAFQLLLALQDDEALRLYCDSLLGPLENGGGGYGDELIRSLEAFIEQNGQWERAARQLYCHRHTLRYRIRRVEELTGRDLGRARDRIEFWLALRGRELVR
jgi:purine catabolism regulator